MPFKKRCRAFLKKGAPFFQKDAELFQNGIASLFKSDNLQSDYEQRIERPKRKIVVRVIPFNSHKRRTVVP